MQHPFVIARQRDAGNSSGALLLSVAVHIVFLFSVFALRFTVKHADGDLERIHPPAVEPIHYFTLAPDHDATPRAATRAKRDAAPAATPSLPHIAMPAIGSIAIPDAPAIPDIDLSSAVNATDSTLVPRRRLTELVKPIVGDPTSVVAHTGPYAKEEVDKMVVPYGNNPKPVYPWRLQQDGVEGSFVAQFVVDSTGRVVEGSMSFPATAHRLFIDAVRQALRRSRYFPAEIGGRRVMQLVEQRFTFVLVSGRGERR